MFLPSLHAQASGVNFEDRGVFSMIERRTHVHGANGSSTIKDSSGHGNFGYHAVLADRDNNLYRIFSANRRDGFSDSDGIYIEKFDAGDHISGTPVWQYIYSYSTGDIYPKYAAVSSNGTIAVIAEDAEADDAFIWVIDNSGTVQKCYEYGTKNSGADVSPMRCWWFDDNNSGTPDVLYVLMYTTQASVGGDTTISPVLKVMGDPDGNRWDNESSRYDRTYLLGSTTESVWAPIGGPMQGHGNAAPDGHNLDNESWWMFNGIGQSNAFRYKFTLTKHDVDGTCTFAKKFDFSSLSSVGQYDNMTLGDGYTWGEFLIHDMQYLFDSDGTGYWYLYAAGYFRDLDPADADHDANNPNVVTDTNFIIKLSETGVVWCKKFEVNTKSGSYGNLNSRSTLFGFMTRTFVPVDRGIANNDNDKWPSAADGIVFPYLKEGTTEEATICLVHIDEDGDAVKTIEVDYGTATSPLGDAIITGFSLTNDMDNNMYLNAKPYDAGWSNYVDADSFNWYVRNSCIKLPNMRYADYPTDVEITSNSANAEAKIVIRNGTNPTFTDGASEITVSSQTNLSVVASGSTHFYVDDRANVGIFEVDNTTRDDLSGDWASKVELTSGEHFTGD